MAMLNNQMAIQPPKSFGDFLWILETRGATERWCRWLVEKNIVLGDLTGKIGDLAGKIGDLAGKIGDLTGKMDD